MRIYIPTYKRADSQTTFENLPTEIQKKVIMVVQQQERDQYDYDCEYLVVADEIGIAKTRELIYYHAGNNHFAMLDDDIKFYRRNSKYYDEEPNMDTSKRLMTLEDWNDWLDQLNTWFSMHDVMHVGHRDLSLPPAGVNHYFNKLFIAAHWIDGSKLSKFVNDVDWNLAQVGEDNVLAIECAMHGHKNITSDEFCMDRWSTAFAEGGCSEFRTSEVNEIEHIKICEKYPYLTMTNKYDEWKHIGRIRKFKCDLQSAYKSSHTPSLQEFF
jgi:hypothetical protein